MRILYLIVSLFFFGTLSSRAAHATSATRLRIDPHAYASARGEEPNQQLVTFAGQRWAGAQWEVRLHAEMETRGRRDLSLDLDRAWHRFDSSFGQLTFGRIHPWDISENPAATRPWSLLANRVPTTSGLMLGYGYSEANDPRPLLLGWLGAHYWLGDERLAFGASASPFFVPSLGPALSLRSDAPASTGRFGRRPPGFVELEGRRYPVRYQLDDSRVLQDVVLQPQFALQARWRYAPNLRAWATALGAPSPDATPEAESYLRIASDGIEAVALVRPKFARRWDYSLTHELAVSWFHLFATAFASSDRARGAEIGAETPYLSVSLLREWTAQSSEARFTDLLLQSEARLPWRAVTFFSGIKTHPREKDLWLRGGIRWSASSEVDVDLGTDLFAGADGTYYGEWRSNDRLYLVLQWRVGS